MEGDYQERNDSEKKAVSGEQILRWAQSHRVTKSQRKNKMVNCGVRSIAGGLFAENTQGSIEEKSSGVYRLSKRKYLWV